jgi:hypothetical protein
MLVKMNLEQRHRAWLCAKMLLVLVDLAHLMVDARVVVLELKEQWPERGCCLKSSFAYCCSVSTSVRTRILR